MPVINSLTWGEIRVTHADNVFTYKDVILYPEGVVEWNWKITDLHHKPGIRIEDLDYINGLTHLTSETHCIITQGFDNKLHCTDDAVAWLKNQNIPFTRCCTDMAMSMYNSLVAQGVKVVGFFHSTC